MQVNPQTLEDTLNSAPHRQYRRFLRSPSPFELDGLLAVRAGDVVLKEGPKGMVFRGQRQGGHWVIKQYRGRWLDRFRVSKARRAWAGCQLLRAAGLPTVRPVGFHEAGADSWFVYECLEGAMTAREWIKPRMHLAPAAEREQVSEELLALLIGLYEAGVYHADTKAGNLLVKGAEQASSRHYAWIDLECVSPVAQVSREQVVRNLLQLNGSIGRKIPRSDRQRFLDRLAETMAWAAEPGLIDELEAATRVRLLREVRRECGH